jgi:hypothetical protein
VLACSGCSNHKATRCEEAMLDRVEIRRLGGLSMILIGCHHESGRMNGYVRVLGQLEFMNVLGPTTLRGMSSVVLARMIERTG